MLSPTDPPLPNENGAAEAAAAPGDEVAAGVDDAPALKLDTGAAAAEAPTAAARAAPPSPPEGGVAGVAPNLNPAKAGAGVALVGALVAPAVAAVPAAAATEEVGGAGSDSSSSPKSSSSSSGTGGNPSSAMCALVASDSCFSRARANSLESRSRGDRAALSLSLDSRPSAAARASAAARRPDRRYPRGRRARLRRRRAPAGGPPAESASACAGTAARARARRVHALKLEAGSRRAPKNAPLSSKAAAYCSSCSGSARRIFQDASAARDVRPGRVRVRCTSMIFLHEHRRIWVPLRAYPS